MRMHQCASDAERALFCRRMNNAEDESGSLAAGTRAERTREVYSGSHCSSLVWAIMRRDKSLDDSWSRAATSLRRCFRIPYQCYLDDGWFQSEDTDVSGRASILVEPKVFLA